MDAGIVSQVTSPLIQDALSKAMDALARAKSGDPQAAQEFQMHMAMYQVWSQLNIEMVTLLKGLNTQAVRAINA